MPAKPTKVYAVPGVFVVGEPAVDHEVETKAEAEALVDTGAFALTAADAKEASNWAPQEAAPAAEEPAADEAEEEEAN